MIPKIIHYCWFGRNPIPSEYKKYIDSWRKFLPDYEIKEWNEDNYDVNCIPFSKEAYEVGKFAYVSDYARLKILYEHGGLYFDTDVEVIRPMDDLMEQGAWMGIEKHTATPDKDDMVAIGLGFAVMPKNAIIKEIMAFYENHHYIYPDGHMEQIPIVSVVSDVLRKHGMPAHIEKPTIVGDITIYPWDYLCPQEFLSNKVEITDHTFTIHHYGATWMSWSDKMKMRKGKLGNKVRSFIKRLKCINSN
jgi:hypothetical protein